MDILFRLAGPVATAAAILLALLTIPPLLLYVIARWRAARDIAPDPQLGLKFALYYFATTALQLGLAGVALLIYMVISPTSAAKGEGYRAAIGFILPAGLVLAAHVALLKRTNDAVFPNVRRLFWGYSFVITGLVAFFALVVGFQALVAKGTTHGVGHTAGAMIVVYGGAWAVIGYKLGQLVLGNASPPPPPATYVDPQYYAPPPPPPVTQTTPGLPALGGGSFPPIDPQK